jgi:alpha-tubulin suppressor-like RCC1 family protein
MPVKDNNAGRDVISEASIIDWQYETADPLGKEIVNIEWAGDKREQYPIGNYEIKLRVQNESLYWSDWISYKFEVKQEKPTAVIKMTPELIIRTNTKITWDSNSSYDSDEDGIKNVEWDNKKDVYNTAGNHTIKLRVQDNEGYWSDWVEKTFSVLDAFEVKSIAQGYDHTLFLLKNGSVKSYLTGNHNSYGQMGINPMISKKSDIISLINTKEVFAGQFVSFALAEDKTVKAWGYNTYGQLGVGSNTNVFEPTVVQNLTNVKKVSVSQIESRTVLFLLENGEVMGSGANTFNKLSGSDSSFKTNTPIKIVGLENVVDVFMTQQNGYAILNDGKVKAWGVKYGHTPVFVPELEGAIEIGHDYDVEVALFKDGTVKGRGTNKSLLFGVNTPYKTTVFTEIQGLQDIKEIELKVGSSTASLLARSSDGIVHTLGDTSGGVLGD